MGISECVVKKRVDPVKTCPSGFSEDQGTCVRRTQQPTTQSCPEGWQLTSESGSHESHCERTVEIPGTPSCPFGYIMHKGEVLDGKSLKSILGDTEAVKKVEKQGLGFVCIKEVDMAAECGCSEGWHLDRVTGHCRRLHSPNGIPHCREGWSLDRNTGLCSKLLEEEPLFACSDNSPPYMQEPHSAGQYGSLDCATVEDNPPSAACSARIGGRKTRPVDYKLECDSSSSNHLAQLSSMEATGKESREVIGRSVRRDGVPVCLVMERTTPEVTCDNSLSPPSFVGSQRETHANTKTPNRPMEATIQSILSGRTQKPEVRGVPSISIHGESEDLHCRKDEVVEPTLMCTDGKPPSNMFGKCEVFDRSSPRMSCPQSYSLDAERHACVKRHHEPAVWACPTGYNEYQISKNGERKKDEQKLLDFVPPNSSIMPFDRTLRSFEKRHNQKSGHSDSDHVHSRVCERTEFATVQVVCPVGYRMQTDKKEKGEGCIAEKHVPGTPICEPGFFMEGNKCIKHVEVAPALADSSGRSYKCVTTSHEGITCGVQGEWAASVNPKKLGKGRVDKVRKRI
eukprot:GHVT01077913.1.p1 GENE.GHVT01077913.1~~GHVT01077913.1.p1  ORF type:complete len:568 (+),score=21.76 GHVT01077913.1:1031-2734(+)